MNKKIVTCLLLVAAFVSAEAQVPWPKVTSTTRPWTRWWWEGSAVNAKGLTWNLEQYRAAGLGGVEVTPIYGIYGFEKEFLQFLSPRWMDAFQHTLKEAKRLDLGVDLANGTGWPFGGPWVKDEDASKTVYHKTYTVNGGESLKELIEYRVEAMVRTANNKPAGIDSILRPVSLNKNLQALALDQIVYPGSLPLQKLMAYSGKVAVDLTKYVDASGRLNWKAPDGTWTLYALFSGLHGKMVERAAPGGEGYAIDHFSLPAATNYFKKFDQSFKGYDLKGLRAFFNDSYEVDDARGQANWTPALLQQFEKIHGYKLEHHLPALFGKDSPEKARKVLYDYRAVIDELLLKNFTETWKKWGASKGAMVRNQSHGSPANTLDLYSVVDIPETEGTDVLRFKFASSASHVTGKTLTAAESATWLNEHFLSSWGDVKKAIDLYFLGGVNHIVYHGTAYSPQAAPWPGWLFYAAVHFQPTNPQWKDFKTLNDYITRVQSFLQTGKPDNDVLLYYPIADRYSEPGNALLQHFDGMERNFEKTAFEHVSKWMLEEGYGFDFFSDRQLQKFSLNGKKISTGGNTYQTILLPANQLMPLPSFTKLLALANSGATVLVYKNLPKEVPGFAQAEKRQTALNMLLSQMKLTDMGTLKKAVHGKGAFIVSDDLDALFAAGNVRREQLPAGLRFERRKQPYGYTYFINNRSDSTLDQWLPISVAAASVALFDPMLNVHGLARWRQVSNGTIEVKLQVKPYGSIIVQTYNGVQTAAPFVYNERTGTPQEIKGNWAIEFLEGGPQVPSNVTVSQLRSWTDIEGDAVKNFSGTARYTTTFSLPAGDAQAWELNLGKVAETAELFLNGTKVATLVGPHFSVVIPASSFKQQNTLQVVVANLMANRISYMDRNNQPWKIFYNTNMPARRPENAKRGLFDASAWKPLPSGLLGPVTLTAVRYE
jgi:hypothetical protein